MAEEYKVNQGQYKPNGGVHTAHSNTAYMNGQTPEISRSDRLTEAETGAEVVEGRESGGDTSGNGEASSAGVVQNGGTTGLVTAGQDVASNGHAPHQTAEPQGVDREQERDTNQAGVRRSRSETTAATSARNTHLAHVQVEEEQAGAVGHTKGPSKSKKASPPPPLDLSHDKTYPSNSLPTAIAATGKMAVSPPASKTLPHSANTHQTSTLPHSADEAFNFIQELKNSPSVSRPHNAESEQSPLKYREKQKNPSSGRRHSAEQQLLPSNRIHGHQVGGRPISADQDGISAPQFRRYSAEQQPVLPSNRIHGNQGGSRPISADQDAMSSAHSRIPQFSSDQLPVVTTSSGNLLEQEKSPSRSSLALQGSNILRHGRSQTQQESEETDL